MRPWDITKTRQLPVNARSVVLAVLCMTATLSAQAQDGGKYGATNLSRAGTGVKVSDESQTRLHLALDVGIGYNTNPYSLSSAQLETERTANPSARNDGDVFLKMRPFFYLNAGGRKLNLEMGLSGDAGALLGVRSGRAEFLLFNGRAHGRGEFNKDGAISLFAQGSLSTTRRIAELFVGNLTNLAGEANLGTSIRPGGGALILSLDGVYNIQDYFRLGTATATSDPATLDSQSYYGHARIAWRFLPKTSVFIDGRYGAWVNTAATSAGLTINPLWVNAGITGKISERVSTTIAAGYANVFISGLAAGASSTSAAFGAQAEVDWKINDRSRLAIGAKRDVSPVPTFLDMYTNSLYLRYDQRFFQKVAFLLNPSVNYLEFGKPSDQRADNAVLHRSDMSLDIRAEVVYFIREWFGVGFAGQGAWRLSNADALEITTSTRGLVAAGSGFQHLYNRYEAVLFASLNY